MDHNALQSLSRAQLAQLAREYMLAAQFNSRTGYAALRINHGDEAYKDVAIDNWMAASPVYTQRMQRAMGLTGGTDIETIFKGLQLDCGFAHQYFDARFQIDSSSEGRFWLQSCGALLEAEPRGEDAVRVMCHDIEDPTFDATAIATNPRARVRPIHRPPRVPTQRSPHCEWRVFIDPQAEPLQEPAVTATMRETRLANLALENVPENSDGGLDAYVDEVQEQLYLERFSHAALVTICKELCIQLHLLTQALGLAASARYGKPAALDIAEFQMAGACWVVSERLRETCGNGAQGIDEIIDIMRVHPALLPAEYYRATVEKTGSGSAVLRLADCPAGHEDSGFGWYPLLQEGRSAGLAALVQGINPRTQITPATESMCWTINLDQDAPPAEEPLAVQVAKGSVLYRTKLDGHIALIDLS